MPTFSFTSKSVLETAAWAGKLADLLRPNDILALDGDLGAGKTAFVTGLAEKLNVKGQIASPTFTLLRDHEPANEGLALYHFDAYRLSGADEWYELGFDEYFEMGGITAVEWASLIKEALPARTIHISLERAGDNNRFITVTWADERQLQATVE
ncbi:MAG TPA: tRNA (adenosine(37)-N6)-threonylcarbamoyltransferase complex ATPase subunit type 1 TsaE [Clostridiaceae bacterium]|nr:tRNA (adenosine(37)-N6)-threonylcarbamoyltransferase complex ATPase subunit type 1 TsaE [Clostridiaceae bacterium]